MIQSPIISRVKEAERCLRIVLSPDNKRMLTFDRASALEFVQNIFLTNDIVKFPIQPNLTYENKLSNSTEGEFQHDFGTNYLKFFLRKSLYCIGNNGQILSKIFYKWKNDCDLQQMQKQIYFFHTNQLYIIYHRGRIIRKSLYIEGGLRCSKRFIACFSHPNVYLYDLSTGATVLFISQYTGMYSMSSNYIAIGDTQILLYKLPDDLKMYKQLSIQEYNSEQAKGQNIF